MNSRIKYALLALTLCWSTLAMAQIPNGYYNNAANKTGDELKTALHNIVKNGHKSVGYDGLWTAYKSTDLRTDYDNKIWDIYSDIPGGTPPYLYTYKTNQCGTYSTEGDCYNREHTWPQSWFNEQATPKADLHHVFPTDGKVNGKRENHPYGEVQSATWTSQNGSKLGSCKTSLGYSGTVFEPIDAYKGDIARAYFYMSVRYYTEDGSWGSSGMTEKSVIKDWAMTMLLRWNEEDPVSQKEIDRNNAIYDIQKNRNPFIDHPEYARMIWDPDNAATTYTITYANVSNGSVSGPESAAEGNMVAITATPAAGYMVSSYTVYKTGTPSTTVPVSSTGTFTMPAYAVTVSATFTVNSTYYNITAEAVTNGSISVSANTAKSGTTVTMTATPDNGYSLYSWYVYKTGDESTIHYSGTTGSFTMPAYDVTVYATFSTSTSGGDYVKVTSINNLEDGYYLIVSSGTYSNTAFSAAFDGSKTTTSLDANSNKIDVTISDNTIESSTSVDASSFYIKSVSGGYSIKSKSGIYIGRTANTNGMDMNTNQAIANAISFNDGNAIITGTGSNTSAKLQYNAQKNTWRFRYYTSSQQPIQLYKQTSTATTPTHTITFLANGTGVTGSMSNQPVDENTATALTPNSFSREGYEFDGWNTASDGSGTYYADEATVTLLADLELYAQWDPKYSITLTQPTAGGTISANHTSAVEGTTVTLTANANTGYVLDHWTVTDAYNNEITVTENQFDMPASNVTVTASFAEQDVTVTYQYEKVTSAPTDWSGTYLLIYEESETTGKVWTGTNSSNSSGVSISNSIIAYSADMVSITIAPMSGGYSIKVNGGTNTGKYISGSSSDNTIIFNNSQQLNTLTYESTGVKITSNSSVMRWNTQSSIFRYYKSSSYSSQSPIQLYKRTETVTVNYPVAYSVNGVVGSPTNVPSGTSITLAAGTDLNADFTFAGWTTNPNDVDTRLQPGSNVTIEGNTTFYAVYAKAGETTAGTQTVILDGNATGLTSTASSTTISENGFSYYVTGAKQQAVVSGASNAFASGNTILIGKSGAHLNNTTPFGEGITKFEVYANKGATNKVSVGINFSANTISSYNANASNTWTQTLSTLDHVYDASSVLPSGAKYFWFQVTNANNAQVQFRITYNTSVSSVEYYTRVFLNESATTDLAIVGPSIIPSGNTLNMQGHVLTNDLGSSSLIIEDGAQLYHNNTGVRATMKMAQITGFGESLTGSYHLIASPVKDATYNNTAHTNLAAGDYDLYAYNADEDEEWRNFKVGGNNLSTLNAGQGYLYAHSTDIDPLFMGELNIAISDQPLPYLKEGSITKNIYLAGNTLAHNQNFYVRAGGGAEEFNVLTMNTDGNGFVSAATSEFTASPMQGFFVQGGGDSRVLSTSAGTRGEATGDVSAWINTKVLNRQGGIIDNAIVSFSNAPTMQKYYLSDQASHLYIPQGNEDYAVVRHNGLGQTPVNFKAAKNDAYTLKVETQNVDVKYLHLIDNLTGADIDLLANPSYTFNANVNDYASRFRLVFNANNNNENENANGDFAFISNGEIVLTGVADNAIVQVIDMMGRVIITRRDAMHCVSTAGMTPGVYVLRLITGTDVKVQKIVIE